MKLKGALHRQAVRKRINYHDIAYSEDAQHKTEKTNIVITSEHNSLGGRGEASPKQL